MAGASPATTILPSQADSSYIVVAGLAPAIMLTNEPFMAMLYYGASPVEEIPVVSMRFSPRFTRFQLSHIRPLTAMLTA